MRFSLSFPSLVFLEIFPVPETPMPSEPEYLAPIYVLWRRAAEIRRGWSKQTRANRRRQARRLLRRIGLDESLLPPITIHYRPGDKRYRPPDPTSDDPYYYADDEPPPPTAAQLRRIRPPRIRRRAMKYRV